MKGHTICQHVHVSASYLVAVIQDTKEVGLDILKCKGWPPCSLGLGGLFLFAIAVIRL